MKRADRGDQTSSAWVFPGGLIEASDADCHDLCAGIGDAAASATLGVDQGGLDFYVAAIRECFEEAGLLFAVAPDGEVPVAGELGAQLAACRAALHQGQRKLTDVCAEFGLRLAADQLHYIGHWVTPLGLPKRFNTRFFLAVAPPGQVSMHDAIETLEHVWLPAAAALAPEDTRKMLRVTRSIIELVGEFRDMAALLNWAASPRQVERVMQRRAMNSAGPVSVMPHEPAFDEIGRLDPEGQGTTWCELRAHVPVRLSPHLLRIHWHNEGNGNTYLIGDEADGWVVVDPGPRLASHLDSIVSATAGNIQSILLTDGTVAEGASVLAERTGAPVMKATLPGRVLVSSNKLTVEIVAAPDNPQRVCYLLVDEKTLLTGSTPTDAARQLLPPHAVEWLAPGQGFLIAAK